LEKRLTQGAALERGKKKTYATRCNENEKRARRVMHGGESNQNKESDKRHNKRKGEPQLRQMNEIGETSPSPKKAC